MKEKILELIKQYQDAIEANKERGIDLRNAGESQLAFECFQDSKRISAFIEDLRALLEKP